jgi:biotin transport system substrate-specific component
MQNELGLELGRGRAARVGRAAFVIGLGAALVALAAQVQVPAWPVPFTLQPLAVLVVGGLLGARRGAAALVTYLVLGCLGLPVFAGGAAGAVYLIGPTGGYLLAFPVAAAVAGRLAGTRPTAGRALLACAAAMLVIHIGGISQLAALRGDLDSALRFGFYPFVTGDLVKAGLAALLLVVAPTRLRAAL